MKILCVDDEKPALGNLMRKLSGLSGVDSVAGFQTAGEALDYAGREAPDVAFLDVNMPGGGGLALAGEIRACSEGTHIVFVTGYAAYAVDAFRMHAAGYVLKPAAAEELQAELDHVRSLGPRRAGSRIRVQCFGNFEVFADGKPLRFRYKKSKELLAYLIDRRGAAFNTAELCVVLWEDAENSRTMRSQFRNIVADLTGTLAGFGCGDVVRKEYNQLSVCMDAFDSDLADYLAGDAAAARAYNGEYMSQYSWAETSPAMPPHKP